MPSSGAGVSDGLQDIERPNITQQRCMNFRARPQYFVEIAVEFPDQPDVLLGDAGGGVEMEGASAPLLAQSADADLAGNHFARRGLGSFAVAKAIVNVALLEIALGKPSADDVCFHELAPPIGERHRVRVTAVGV